MKRRTLLKVLAMIPVMLSAHATTSAVDDSKLETLGRSLGMTSEQAQAGAGAMLKLAQARLPLADYDRIAGVVPRANEYMALASRLGAFEGATPTPAGLSGAFDKLGVTPEQAAKFVPALQDYVSDAAGRDVGMLFGNALK